MLKLRNKKILSENKERSPPKGVINPEGRSVIYLFTNIKTDRIYVSSAINLSLRLNYYYTPS